MIIHREIYVLVLFVNLCCSLCKQAIYIGGFFPMQDGLWDASGILPAAEMADFSMNYHFCEVRFLICLTVKCIIYTIQYKNFKHLNNNKNQFIDSAHPITVLHENVNQCFLVSEVRNNVINLSISLKILSDAGRVMGCIWYTSCSRDGS
jgi:hypothetical protein